MSVAAVNVVDRANVPTKPTGPNVKKNVMIGFLGGFVLVMLLVGVRPDYQNSGINSLVMADMFRKYSEKGVKWAETNAILETNLKNQGQFKDFESERKKRRRSYIKPLDY